jgi:DnaT DNA-binding domain
MFTSLIPERPLLISPTLAATIGLEEAVLLHVLSELVLRQPGELRQQRQFFVVNPTQLQEAMPFWSWPDIQRVQASLQTLGLLLVEGTTPGSNSYWVAINQSPTNIRSPQPVAPSKPIPPAPSANSFAPNSRNQGSAQPLPVSWRPDPTVFLQCAQRNIPREFVDNAVVPFTLYHRERGKTHYSWQRAFLTWVIADWEKQRSTQSAKTYDSAMSSAWLPSEEALSILEHGGISHNFIEAAVPEFILYWKEKGTVTSEWNSRFIAHVRRQWESYRHALENDNTPRPIPLNFTPDPACYDVLAMANIDVEFADALLKEFVLYWRDRNEIHRSWNTKFLQFVKFRWAQQGQAGQSLLDKFTDRSWAE